MLQSRLRLMGIVPLHEQYAKPWATRSYIEQDHRGIKQRSYPRRGFGSFASAARFCRAFDELRQFFQVRISREQKGSLAHKREVFRQHLDALQTLVSVVSEREVRDEPDHMLCLLLCSQF